MSSKKCPNCGLYNIETALRCDCGYDFASGQVKESLLTQKERETLPPATQLASSSKRLANFVIDVFGFQVVLVVILIFFGSDWALDEQNINLVFLVCLFFYYFVFEAVFQKTVGKLLTRTKVVTSNGSKPELGAIFLRTLSRFVPFEAFSGKDGSWWHDRWTKTWVVND